MQDDVRQLQVGPSATLPSPSWPPPRKATFLTKTLEKVCASRRDRANSMKGKMNMIYRKARDDKTTGAAGFHPRPLSFQEKESIEKIFKEMAGPACDEKGLGGTLLPWAEISKRLQRRLSNDHIRRFAALLSFPKRCRMDVYTDRVAILMHQDSEQMSSLCFGLLDVDGDNLLGARDIFKACSSRCVEGDDDDDGEPATGHAVDAVFKEAGPIGVSLDFVSVPGAPVVHIKVVAVTPGSIAEAQGIRQGDRVTHVGGVPVDSSPQEARSLLSSSERPMRIQLLRPNPRAQRDPNIIPTADLKHLLAALKENSTCLLAVTFVGASDLRRVDGSVPDAYCVCELKGKPHTRVKTRVVHDSANIFWNERHQVAGFGPSDSLKFTVYAHHAVSNEEVLGSASLEASSVKDDHFSGILQLQECGKGAHSSISIKVEVLNSEQGVALAEFRQLFNTREFSFLPSLVKILSGIDTRMDPSRDRGAPEKAKVRVTVVNATGLRSLEGTCDPYCTIEVVGRRETRAHTKVLHDTLDPSWNQRLEVKDVAPTDSLRFVVFDMDSGQTSSDDHLGQAMLKASQFWGGWDGSVTLVPDTERERARRNGPDAKHVGAEPAGETWRGQSPALHLRVEPVELVAGYAEFSC